MILIVTILLGFGEVATWYYELKKLSWESFRMIIFLRNANDGVLVFLTDVWFGLEFSVGELIESD